MLNSHERQKVERQKVELLNTPRSIGQVMRGRNLDNSADPLAERDENGLLKLLFVQNVYHNRCPDGSRAPSDLLIPARGHGRATKDPTLIDLDRILTSYDPYELCTPKCQGTLRSRFFEILEMHRESQDIELSADEKQQWENAKCAAAGYVSKHGELDMEGWKITIQKIDI